MTIPNGFHIADFGDELDSLVADKYFKSIEIKWTKPRIWRHDECAPIDDAEKSLGHLYAIIREHHRARTRENIAYVGISTKLKERFNNHPKADKLTRMRGTAKLTIGNVQFPDYTRKENIQRIIGELEHILILAVWPEFNDRKLYSLPGFGKSGSCAWRVINTGHRFAGRMPREIVYPWMLIKPGRDRSLKNE